MTADHLPPTAYAACLAGAPGIASGRLRTLLQDRAPSDAFAILAGAAPLTPGLAAAVRRTPELPARWRAHVERHPPHDIWAQCQQLGVAVHILGDPGYPPLLALDREAPAVVFTRGDLGVLDGRRVAVIGTRNATATGRDLARELGAGLALAGVRVVSGLARGIDGAAHRGALAVGGAPPVGVVACGLDVVYPGEHRELWEAVAVHGLLLSEVPPGTSPEPFRFPLRNRILAALAEIVVVVESRAAGGSLLTVDAAERRGIPVMAVPGSPRNRAAEGTNALIADGVPPVRDVADVMVALGLDTSRVSVEIRRGRSPLTPPDEDVLDLFGDEPLDLERILHASGRGMGETALALARLEADGWLIRTGGWYERAGGRS